MKKMIELVLAIAALAVSQAAAETVKKKGFLATKWCVERGYFKDCKLESYKPGAELVLYVHDDLQYYTVDTSKIAKHEVDEGFARNGVSITGELDPKTNTIHATKYDAPPPPAKSFFKGCL